MRRTIGMIGSVLLIFFVFAAAAGNASGPEIAAALNRIADAMQPTATPQPTPLPAPLTAAAAGAWPANDPGPWLLWLVMTGIGGIMLLIGWTIYCRANPSTEIPVTDAEDLPEAADPAEDFLELMP